MEMHRFEYRSPRFTIEDPISVAFHVTGLPPFNGSCNDLGPEGAGISLAEIPPIGTEGVLSFLIRDSHVQIRSRLVYRDGDRTGFLFLTSNADEEGTIRQMIEKCRKE